VNHESCNSEFPRSLLKEDVVLIINANIFFNIQTETFSWKNTVKSYESQLFEVREQTDKAGTDYNDKKMTIKSFVSLLQSNENKVNFSANIMMKNWYTELESLKRNFGVLLTYLLGLHLHSIECISIYRCLYTYCIELPLKI